MDRPRISASAALVRESRIRRLTIEARRFGAANLAQAFPDYAPPAAFVDAVARACASSLHQYTDTWGAFAARKLIAEYVHRFHPSVHLDPDQNVLITIGAMEAMNDALAVALDPGDEAIVLEPFYECFVAQILSRHGVPKFVRMPFINGTFRLDIDAVQCAVGPKTRAILVNTPGNPSGSVFTRAELEGLLKVCRTHGLWMISDETYEHIYLQHERPASVLDVDSELTNSVVLSGFGKTFGVTGWRIGYILANDEFTRAIRPLHDVNTICAVPMIQEALPALTASPAPYFDDLRAEYARRFEILKCGLEASGFEPNRVDGAYYIFARIPKWWRGNGENLNQALLEGGFVTGVPGAVFYGPGGGDEFIRYTFCKKIESMKSAVERLAAGIRSLQQVTA